jgi:hypothetical protein
VRTPEFGKAEGRTADPSASPDLLSRVAASVDCMWFSLGRTNYLVASESGEVGNPGTLGMTILLGDAKYSFQDELSSRPERRDLRFAPRASQVLFSSRLFSPDDFGGRRHD